MAQHDYVIDNQTFPATRTDLNNAAAIVSQNAGATAPSTTYAYQLWYDTTSDILKMRNADDDAWITLFTFDQATDSVQVSGEELVDDPSPQLGANLDLNNSDITGTGDINITGDITATSFTGDGSGLTGVGGGGKVLQVQQGLFTGRATTTSTGFVSTGITVTITPSSTSSKILVNSLCHLAWDNGATKAAITLYRTIGGSSAEIFLGDADGSRRRTTSNLYLGEDTRNGWPITTVYLDSPATTSAVTYQILFARMDGAGTVGINRGIDSYSNASNWGTSASSIVVMEIGA
jgi:hypothetical protein